MIHFARCTKWVQFSSVHVLCTKCPQFTHLKAYGNFSWHLQPDITNHKLWLRSVHRQH